VNVLAPGTLAVPGRAFYVAANGNDSWSGRLAQPNAAGTDGPFATLNAARLAMENDLTTQTTYVEGGDYYLTAPLNLTLKDSGQTWSAYNGQTVNIHAGSLLTGWTNQGNGIWTVKPPAGAMSQGGAIDTLYVNGVAQTDSRFPDVVPNAAGSGWLTAVAGQSGDNAYTQFHFTPGSVPQFPSSTGLYAVVFSQNGWSDVVSPVSSIDYGGNTITLANASPYTIGAGSRFYLFNTGGTPTTPGEYSYDPASNVLTYDAPAGFDGTGASVGTQSLGIGIYGAHGITLSGLTIGDGQSGGYGVQISGSSNIVLQGNKVDDTGTGILVDSGSSNIHLLDNELANLNSYGILITTSANTITADGNNIHDVGVLTSGDGIWFTGSSNDVFSNNVIKNVAKVGIGGGSLIGSSDASYNDVITRNTITGVNQQTADAGGIYLIGRQQDSTGDVVSFNTVTGTSSLNPALPNTPSAGIGAGIYLDDFASGVTVKGNLLQGNVDGVWVHLGSNNTIEQNVITSSLGNALVLDGSNTTGITALQPPTANAFINNTTYLDQPGSIASLIVNALNGASWSGDIVGGPALGSQPFNVDLLGGTARDTWAQWQALGFDTNAAAPSASMTLAAALANLPSS
jgi:parallel beta-helix repeat protein